MLEKSESSKVKGTLILREVLLGRIPTWDELAWLEGRFKERVGKPRQLRKKRDSILASIEFLSKYMLTGRRRITNISKNSLEKHLTVVNNPALWRDAPHILQDIMHSFSLYGKNFSHALISVLSSLPPALDSSTSGTDGPTAFKK